MVMRHALIVGGAGTLGRAVNRALLGSQRFGWSTLSLDYLENAESTSSLALQSRVPLPEQLPRIRERVDGFSPTLDAVLCVAGAFDVSAVADPDVLEKHLAADAANFQSALLAAHLSTHALAPGGLLLLTGAAAVREGPVGFAAAYAASKASTHYLAQLMATRAEIPEDASVCTVLPQIIDTPQNRDAMPDADRSDWQPPEQIAELIRAWADGDGRPENGAFAKLARCGASGSLAAEFV